MSTQVLRRPRALMIDLSGTIHIEDKAVEGAIEAVTSLKQSGMPHLFVTNTSKESQVTLHRRLTKMGFPIERKDIFSSLSAAASIVRKRNLNPMLILQPDAIQDFPVQSNDHDSVLVGLAPAEFNYETMSKAFRLIKEKNAPFLAVNKSRYIMTSEGLKLGPGCFVAGLEYSSGVEAECIGKPEETFFQSALEHINDCFQTHVTREDIVMIGDDIKDDVIGAQKCNFQGCLVKTGKYASGDEDQLSPLKPHYLFSNIAKAIEEFQNQYLGTST